jgi:stage II sporulation protein D (peptidoglycan lytic transglycosylase)
MSRAVKTAAFVIVLLLVAPSVQATELIRVLLAQHISRLTITAEWGVVTRLSENTERVVKGPLHITARSGGFLINGIRVKSGIVRLHARTGSLSINASAGEQDDPMGKPSSRRAVAPSAIGGSSANVPTSLIVAGAVEVAFHGGGLTVINELDLEEYVKGVVPSEISAAWHPEVLKVQAVAARTYGLYQKMLNDGRDYDVVAGVQDQVYRGRHGVDQRVQQAVETTRGLVMTYRNAPILAAFSSTAAGPTEDAMNVWAKDLPYLKGVDCPFDQNSPYYQWQAQFSIDDLEQALRKQGMMVGTIATFTPYSYSRSGRVDKVRILHSEGELIVRGQDLRKAVGYSIIPSTQFEVEAIGRQVVLTGRGSGHAVGLCQWGAKELAEQGYPYTAILRYYFPGTALRPLRGLERPSLSTP